MLRFHAEDFCRASSIIGQCFMELQVGKTASSISLAALNAELGQIEKHCVNLGLTTTLAQLKRVALQRGHSAIPPSLIGLNLIEINSRMADELAAKLFLVMDSASVAYYSEADLFGSEVGVKFSDAAFDIAESGKCLALARFTAAVFHLMRVVELGLHSLSSELSVNYDRANWGVILRHIEAAIGGMEKDAAWTIRPDWRERREAYAQAAGQFSVFRDAWRNHVTHQRGKYTEEEARDVFGAVQAFMRTLAKWLEQPEVRE